MARQRPGAPWLVMGPCIVEIDRIVIREVQYQFEVNRCRNEENIVKGNLGWAWPMWGRGAPGLVMAPCIVEIDCIVIKEVQYQFEVNRCRNEDIIVKGNFGWALPMWAGCPRINCIVIREVQYQFKKIIRGLCGCGLLWAGRPRVGNGAIIVEIDRIVIREVQYQLEVNRCINEEIIVKDNFGWVWLIIGGAPQVEIDCIVIRDVQYQFEVNRCRNEKIIVKGNFGWAWPVWAGRLRVGNGAMQKVQYQFEVNRCRNEEIKVKGNFGWAWPMWADRPRVGNGAMQISIKVNRCTNEEIIVKSNFGWAWPMWAGPCIAEIDRIVIREVQYQFEENRCRNEEIIVKGNFGWAWPMWPGRPRVGNGAMHKAQYQFEVNRCRNEEVNDGRTDGKTHINAISPLFHRETWG
ncbi:hypothetical protein DPMN_187744 [Dreissena polymorpha]|uniref:Uncharacterized protein n=1 Tax=Dreissena polymorpha TaxID=45954 RepID=A0A9D4I9C8_DREPO|nr:hypothetical protein DPMN_187744 [Dreissena polymorpha]